MRGFLLNTAGLTSDKSSRRVFKEVVLLLLKACLSHSLSKSALQGGGKVNVVPYQGIYNKKYEKCNIFCGNFGSFYAFSTLSKNFLLQYL